MNLIFHSTEDFEHDLQEFDETTRREIAERINQVAQAFVHDKRAFAHQIQQPCRVELDGGYDSSLYAVRVEPNVRVLLTVDDDPIFDQVIVTLLRAVPRIQSCEVYSSLIESLYQSLNGCEAAPERGVPIG